MISGGRLIGRVEDEVERVDRELTSWFLYDFGRRVSGMLETHERLHMAYTLRTSCCWVSGPR